MDQDFEGMQFLRQSAALQAVAQTKTIDAKKYMWIPDPDKKGVEGFLAASVKSTNGDKCECETVDGKVSLQFKPMLENSVKESEKDIMFLLVSKFYNF